MRKLVTMHPVPDLPAADDIIALRRRLGAGPPLTYVDLRQREALAVALERWPWLRAVHQHATPDADGRGA